MPPLVNKNTQVLVVWRLPDSGACWKSLSTYSVYPIWALKEQNLFPYKTGFIFPVGPVSCQRTDGFLYFYFRSSSLPPLMGCQGRLHITDCCAIACSGPCFTSHVFQMPSTPACFPSVLLVGCDFPLSMRMSSWYRSCWINLQSGPVPLSQAVVNTCCPPKECRKLCLG